MTTWGGAMPGYTAGQRYPNTCLTASTRRRKNPRLHRCISMLNNSKSSSGSFSELAQQARAHERQQREVARIQRFVERFRYKASKARQAQSRLKTLERMELIAPAHVDSPIQLAASNR